jgi:GH24 family phage-related lysozyme (muramidase)
MEYTSYEMTKKFEALRLKAYQDSVGVWTIGYGHTKGVKEGDTCTEKEADEYLRQDMWIKEAAVKRLVHVPLTQGQYDALCDFAFNLGEGNLASSTLLKLLNAGSYMEAGMEFQKWNKAGGKVLKGLVDRRAAEADLFLHR